MDPIFESYKAVTEAEKWNIFDFYDSHKHAKQAKETTKLILKVLKNKKFGANPKKVGLEISSILRGNTEVGAHDTAAREAIADYIEKEYNEEFARLVFKEL